MKLLEPGQISDVVEGAPRQELGRLLLSEYSKSAMRGVD